MKKEDKSGAEKEKVEVGADEEVEAEVEANAEVEVETATKSAEQAEGSVGKGMVAGVLTGLILWGVLGLGLWIWLK